MFCEVSLNFKLRKMLAKIRSEVPGNIFTGTGVIVCNLPEKISFLPMGDNSRVIDEVDTVSAIIEGSLATNANHDGFNLLDVELNLTYQNVYISPPIARDFRLDTQQGYGARYVTAILVSMIDGVLLTAVVSNSYGIVIFKDGKVVNTSND